MPNSPHQASIPQNRKHLFGFMVFLFMIASGFAQRNTLDSLRVTVKQAPIATEARYNKIMDLAAYYRKQRPTTDIIIDGFQEDYVSYGIEALAWAEEHGSPKQIAQARRYEIDYVLFYNNINPDNFDFFSLGQQMLNEGIFHSKEDEFYVYRKLTDLYQEKRFYKEFLSLIPKKYELARELEKPFSEPFREYASIGTIYYRLKDYDKARNYYRKTLNSLYIDSLTVLKASINNNIALSFSKEEKIDSAIYYYKKSLNIIETGPRQYYEDKTNEYDKHIINVIKANIAYLGVKQGKFDEAIIAIKKELYSGKREDEDNTIVEAYNKLGEIYYYKKQYLMAEKYLDSANYFFKSGLHDNDLIKNLNLQAKVRLVTNRQEKAELFFSRAQKFEDSINLIKSEEQTKIASVIYETQAKEKELQQQKLELAKRNQEILEKEKSQTIYAIVVGALLVSLLLFLWSNKKMKSKKEELEIQKKLVDESLKEKELLLKEIHHRVKNNLQVVSSLLIKQGSVANDERIKRLMEDGQNRIKSMAMVHQLLYQTEDLRNLNLKEYSQLLAESVNSANKMSSRNISITITMPDVFSHIDIAVPYGLILNELLSNCFEHAFRDKNSGAIEITLTPLSDNNYCLTVSDNGIGLPSNVPEKKQQSLGINLVEGLAWQLRGDVSFKSKDIGSEFEVTFSNNLNINS